MMCRQPCNNLNNLRYRVHVCTYVCISCISDNSCKHNCNLSLGHIFSQHITALKNIAKGQVIIMFAGIFTEAQIYVRMYVAYVSCRDCYMAAFTSL